MRVLIFLICMGFALSAGAQTTAELFTRAKKETDPAKQIKLLTQLITKSPRHVGAYHRRGDAYMALQKYPQAIKDYNKVVSLRPTDAFRYFARGLAYTRMNQPALALADFSKAISLKPDYMDFYLERARVGNATGKFVPALEDYKTYTNHWQKADLALLQEIVPVALRAYRFEDVRTLLASLQKKGDDSAPFYAWQGRLLQQEGKQDEAISAYSKAVNRAPDDAQYYRMRGDAYKEMDDLPSALEDFTYSLVLEPEAYWYNRRGKVYEEMNQLELALADYNQALSLDPAWAEAYNDRGYVKALLKDFSAAKQDFEKSIELDPSVPAPYIHLAGIYWTTKKDRKNMYATLRKALAHHFKNTEALYDENQKGWLFKGINKTAEFRSLFYK